MSTTDSPFSINQHGEIVLPDDDGDPAYYLQPDTALALAEFIRDHEREIERAHDTTRAADGYLLLGRLVADGLPAPSMTDLQYDQRLCLSFREPEHFTAWADALDETGTASTDRHPTLGSRPSLTTALFVLHGDWDRVVVDTPPEPVSA